MALLWLPLCFALAGCGKGGPAAESGGDEESTAKPIVQVSTTTIRSETVRATIPVTGTLAPLPNEEAKVAPLVPGRIRLLFVKTGDVVTKGQVIAILESGALTGQVQQAEATARADAATLQQARLNLRSQESAQEFAVTQARDTLRAQQVALDKLLAGSRPQEISQAQAAVTVAETALTNAQQSLARSHTLFGEGLLARKDLEAAETQEKTAQAQVRSAQEALSIVRQGSRPQDIEAGRVAVRQAEDQVRAAEAQAVQNAAKRQDIRIAERQLQAAEGAVRAARSQLASQTIRAPLSGTVVGRTLNPGEAVDVTGAVAVIVNLSRVRVLLNLPASQVAAVRPGQPVEFTVESQPAVLHHATVTVVSRATDAATNTVQAEAVAENADRQLRDDGFVRGVVITAIHRNAPVVPAGSVVEKDGKPTVFVVAADGKAHAKAVNPGLRDGDRVEIMSGVAPGERVVTTGAYELEDGTQVRTGEEKSAGKQAE